MQVKYMQQLEMDLNMWLTIYIDDISIEPACSIRCTCHGHPVPVLSGQRFHFKFNDNVHVYILIIYNYIHEIKLVPSLYSS